MPEQPKPSIYGDSGADAGAGPRPLGLMEQISGVFSEPAKLFSRLSERPQWAGALLLHTALVLAFTVAWVTGVDALEFMAAQIENSAGRMSSEQMQQGIEMGARLMPVFAPLGGLFGTLSLAFLLGAVYWALGLASRESPLWRPTYRHGLVVACVPALAAIPYSLLGAVMASVQPVGALRPDQLVPSSLGYWMEAESPRLSMLYCSLDIFLLFQYAAIFFAAKYAMRSKPWGAALCVAAALLGPIWRIMTAK